MKLRRRLSSMVVAAACLALGAPAFAADETSAVPACPAMAAPPAAAGVKAQLRTASDHGFLWRLQKDGRVSFLYGTLHVGRAGWNVPGPTVWAAYRASDVLALELDMTDPTVLAALSTPPPSKPLPPELDRRLRRLARAHCLPDAVADALPPVLLVSTVVVFEALAEGFDPAYGTDTTLAVLARSDGKRIVSLESVAQQFAALFGDADADDASTFVSSSIDQLESADARPLLQRMTGMWAESRLRELDDYAAWCHCMDTADDRRLMNRMLDERNGPMADAIDRLHAGGQRVFAAVGALHMTGPRGLPRLLAERGYAVRRVSFDSAPLRP